MFRRVAGVGCRHAADIETTGSIVFKSIEQTLEVLDGYFEVRDSGLGLVKECEVRNETPPLLKAPVTIGNPEHAASYCHGLNRRRRFLRPPAPHPSTLPESFSGSARFPNLV